MSNFFSYPNLVIFLLTISYYSCYGDIYLHNPRGSNNRLNENTRERKKDTRLFDSENNNRGGYNEGNVYYLAGSHLQIEWTNQHSCADENTNCDLILQYMCSKNLRDGASTERIPELNKDCKNKNCATDIEYGMHEDNEYYLRCNARRRNERLYLADQNIRGRQSARKTRQNPGGTRYGYECSEERDYYPYWHYSPWKDIAILTNRVKQCDYYRQESANVKSRWECRVPALVLESIIARGKYLPTTREACEGDASLNGTWTEMPAHDIPAPECREAEWTRDNHLGNTVSGHSPTFNWTIPKGENPNDLCTLRIRYNISTSDYDGWGTDVEGPKAEDFGSKFGFPTAKAANQRGYEFKGNPTLQVFGDEGKKLELELAVNTAQFGRVFQDRSHGFSIKPSSVEGVVHNVNVRGLRGNIVQVYPSVEYDFTPNTLRVARDDYIHFQWTGSNNNPNNDGQGRASSDRNNIVLQAASAFSDKTKSFDVPVYGRWGRSYPAYLNSNSNATYLSMNEADLEQLAFSGKSMGDIEELDDAGTYFDLGPRKVTMSGVTYYMCTRNNNFSNRSQKGRIFCDDSRVNYHNVGSNGGTYRTSDGSISVTVNSKSFSGLVKLRMEEWSREIGEKRLAEKNRQAPSGDGYASDFAVIGFSEPLSGSMTVSLKIDETSKPISVYRGNPDTLATWERLETSNENGGYVSFRTDKGVFVARYYNNTNVPLIIGMVFLVLAIIAVIGVMVYLERSRGTFSRFRNNFSSKV